MSAFERRQPVPKHLEDRFGAIEALPQAEPPAPWRRVGVFSVGGLQAVGFAPSADLMLVTSVNGRGVFDCRTGDRLARDDDAGFDFDLGNLEAPGIGPLEGMRIRVAGAFGGGLATVTTDGWLIERQPLAWRDEELILSSKGQSMLWTPAGQTMSLTKLAGFISEVRAFGFSPTGLSLVIATPADVTVYGRDAF